MEWEYNQPIYVNSTFGYCYAKFICYRPDKNTIIFDYDGVLREEKREKVVIAEYQDIIRYYNQQITFIIQSIKRTIREKNEHETKLRVYKNALRRYKTISQKLEQKNEDFYVACKLAPEIKMKNIFINKLNDCNGKIQTYSYKIKSKEDRIWHLKRWIDLDYKKINELQEKKKKLMKEGLFT